MTPAKWIGYTIGVFAVLFALGHFHPDGNPRLKVEQPRSTLLQGGSMPDASRRVLIAKCADCHSDQTRWPIYSKIAPVSWLIEHDVRDGRKHLNLSYWQGVSADQQLVLTQEIVHQTRMGAMPPLSYRLIHWGARLDGSDLDALKLLVPIEISQPGAAAAGDEDRGRALFNRRCSGCHATDSNREGPRLRGVYGRRAGSAPSFNYSSALKNSGVVWTDTNLDRWLSGSDTMLPGTAMGFSVSKPQERSDLIAFLKSLR